MVYNQPFVVVFGAAVRPNGSPSGAMRDRVGAAVRFGRRLLPKPIFIVSGAVGQHGPAEADVMAGLLRERGIAPTNIIRDTSSRNTHRTALAVASLLHGVKGPVYVATSGYHMPRCVLLLGIAGLDAHRSPPAIGPASSRLLRRWYWRLREVPAIPVDCAIMLWHRLVVGIRPPEAAPEGAMHTVEAEPVGRTSGD